jgi:hypothetical protein
MLWRRGCWRKKVSENMKESVFERTTLTRGSRVHFCRTQASCPQMRFGVISITTEDESFVEADR